MIVHYSSWKGTLILVLGLTVNFAFKEIRPQQGRIDILSFFWYIRYKKMKDSLNTSMLSLLMNSLPFGELALAVTL